MTADPFSTLIARITAWAQAEDDVRGALVIGSRARAEKPADAYSDLDIWLLVNQPARYIVETAWLAQIAPVELTFLEKTASGNDMERRVLFAGGLDVDFVPIAAGAVHTMAQHNVLPEDVALTLGRGCRFLVDKDGFAALVAGADLTPQPEAMPDEATFVNTLNDFWYHALWTARKRQRGELWLAASCLNSYLAWRCLLPLLAWHARAGGRAVWPHGRFVEQWADPRAAAALPQLTAHPDGADLDRALAAACGLVSWLGREAAARLGYSYPADEEAAVRAHLRALGVG